MRLIEDCHDAIAIRDLRHLLHGGHHEIEAMRWPRLERVTVDQSCLQLQYRLSRRREWIKLDWTRCFNSYRPWLCCPSCERRHSALYHCFEGYRCRQCTGLVYKCQSISKTKRIRNKIARIERGLGFKAGQIKRPYRMSKKRFAEIRADNDHLHRKLAQYRAKHLPLRAQWDCR